MITADLLPGPAVAGVTGTAGPVTFWQIQRLWELLTVLPLTRLHHGDCVGGDAIGHAIWTMERSEPVTVHPPTKPGKRAFCKGDDVRAEAPFLVRDGHIATEVDVLIAVPSTAHEVRRSGTWTTVRYARKAGKIIIRINRDGTISLG